MNKLSCFVLILFSAVSYAEPYIDVIRGPKEGTSFIVVEHEDGKIDKLLVKNADLKDTKYVEWFRLIRKQALERMKYGN